MNRSALLKKNFTQLDFFTIITRHFWSALRAKLSLKTMQSFLMNHLLPEMVEKAISLSTCIILPIVAPIAR